MSNMIPFEFDTQQVRVVEKDGDNWFVAKDVALALGYRDAPEMTRVLDEEEKGYTKVRTLGGEQNLTVISESGLYHATFVCRKPNAKPFRRWVTEEVLPTIRKTGSYQVAQPAPAPVDPTTDISRASAIASALDGAARAFGFDDNMRLLSVNQAVQKRTGINLLEELGATHLLSPMNERYLTPTELGMPLDMSAIAINRLLRDKGFQRQERDGKGKAYWVMTEAGRQSGGRMLDTGKRHSDGAPVQQLKWPESIAEALREDAA